jgi:hypothetical protein
MCRITMIYQILAKVFLICSNAFPVFSSSFPRACSLKPFSIGKSGMGAFVIGCALICGAPAIAHAKALVRTATSGQPALMYVYMNWKRDCSPDLGIVKVLSKPQHGKLTPRRVDAPIGPSRFYGITHCHGKPTKGFQVHYTSVPGFRGIDRFAIEATYTNHAPEVDTFTVTVE